MPEGEAIEHPLVLRSLESAQRKVEPQLRYPQATARIRRCRQRPAQGHLRAAQRTAPETEDILETITAMRQGVYSLYRTHVPEGLVEEQWGPGGARARTEGELMLSVPVQEWAKNEPNLRR